ncbi:MAG TPA: hypothetical protein VGG65_04280 [Thermoanaerobaculia bacterium]
MSNAGRTASTMVEDARDGFETAKAATARHLANAYDVLRVAARAAGGGLERLSEWCRRNPGRGLSAALVLGFLAGRHIGGRAR